MTQEHLQRLDRMLGQLAKIHGLIQKHREVEFDIDHLLPIVEASVDALATEIDSEMERAR